MTSDTLSDWKKTRGLVAMLRAWDASAHEAYPDLPAAMSKFHEVLMVMMSSTEDNIQSRGMRMFLTIVREMGGRMRANKNVLAKHLESDALIRAAEATAHGDDGSTDPNEYGTQGKEQLLEHLEKILVKRLRKR